jgi:hypothetical protein
MKKSWIFLVALAAVAAWASVETFRLADATQQAADSQQLQLRVARKVEASRSKNVEVAHAETATPGGALTDKR